LMDLEEAYLGRLVRTHDTIYARTIKRGELLVGDRSSGKWTRRVVWSKQESAVLIRSEFRHRRLIAAFTPYCTIRAVGASEVTGTEQIPWTDLLLNLSRESPRLVKDASLS
jgi:hypothetical protein